MKALTVQNPWAWAIIHGQKTVENRTQRWKYRGPLAIHAGLRWSHRGNDIVSRLTGVDIPPFNVGHPSEIQGAIIGVVQLVDCHYITVGCCDSPWAETWYTDPKTGLHRQYATHLVLADPRPIEPIVCRGALGLWTVPDHLIGDLT